MNYYDRKIRLLVHHNLALVCWQIGYFLFFALSVIYFCPNLLAINCLWYEIFDDIAGKMFLKRFILVSPKQRWMSRWGPVSETTNCTTRSRDEWCSTDRLWARREATVMVNQWISHSSFKVWCRVVSSTTCTGIVEYHFASKENWAS